VAWYCCLGLGPYHLNRGSGLSALFAGLLGCKLPWAICILGYFNSGYPTGYPRAGQNTRARTRLGSGRVRVRPAGEKSCPCPSPSGRVPGGYPLPVPKLTSLFVRQMHLPWSRSEIRFSSREPSGTVDTQCLDGSRRGSIDLSILRFPKLLLSSSMHAALSTLGPSPLPPSSSPRLPPRRCYRQPWRWRLNRGLLW
jgi:hypothetical protein